MLESEDRNYMDYHEFYLLHGVFSEEIQANYDGENNLGGIINELKNRNHIISLSGSTTDPLISIMGDETKYYFVSGKKGYLIIVLRDFSIIPEYYSMKCKKYDNIGWTFEGSSNGIDWTILDTKKEQTSFNEDTKFSLGICTEPLHYIKLSSFSNTCSIFSFELYSNCYPDGYFAHFLKKSLSRPSDHGIFMHSDKNSPYTLLSRDFYFPYYSSPNCFNWFQLDFENQRLQITGYTFEVFETASKAQPMRSWIVLGSNDEEKWEIIDEKRHDEEQCVKKKFPYFPVKISQPYRFIRYVMTDSNANNRNIMVLKSIEVFGSLHNSSNNNSTLNE